MIQSAGHNDPDQLSYRTIFLFWCPLALTWLLMAVEGPFLSAVIARLAQEKLNLAAYGIALALAMIAESPVIMLMSAGTALCRDRDSYLRLRNFSFILSLAVTLLFILFLLPIIFTPIMYQLFGLPAELVRLTHKALLCLIPWPGAIGIRRFYQGVLIATHQTKRIATATLFRLIGMAGSALLFYHLSTIRGAIIGALALTTGVVAEAILTRYLANPAIHSLRHKEEQAPPRMTSYRQIWNYYLPLALTPFAALAVHPLVTFFLGKSRDAMESLAVMPVIYGLTFIFRAIGLSYQEVAIALISENHADRVKIKNFATLLGISVTACLMLIAWTPANRFWFQAISGLSPELSNFAIPALKLMTILPALTVVQSFQRSILIVAKTTRPVSMISALETLTIFLCLWMAIDFLPVSGAIAAAGAYVSGRILAVVILQKSVSTAGAFTTGHDIPPGTRT